MQGSSAQARARSWGRRSAGPRAQAAMTAASHSSAGSRGFPSPLWSREAVPAQFVAGTLWQAAPNSGMLSLDQYVINAE